MTLALKGKKHSDERIKNNSLAQKGKKWCYNTITLENKIIPKDSELPEGYIYGRKIK
jgi:hypothetical protein